MLALMFSPTRFNCGKRSFKLLCLRETNLASPSLIKQVARQPSHFGSNSHSWPENGLGTSVGSIGSSDAGIAASTAAGGSLFLFDFFRVGILGSNIFSCLTSRSNATNAVYDRPLYI